MAQIKKRSRPDEDIPEMTAAEFARAKPLRSAMPEVVDARGASVPGLDPAPMQERFDAIRDARAGVCAASMDCIPNQRRTR